MISRLFISLGLLVASSAFLYGQNASECPCCTTDHRQFDFWLGQWVVYDTTGSEVGQNNIILLQDSCLLQENWTGSMGGTGTSYNYFDNTDGSWNQLWIDNSGSILKLKGNFSKGKMLLESDFIEGPNEIYRNRITWELRTDGSVIQTWDMISECDKLLQRLFKGIYRKTG